MIVLLDTNILARGAISRATAVSAILDAWLAGAFTLAMTPHILDEVARTLRKPYFARRLRPQDAANYQHHLATLATMVPVSVQVAGVATHPEDDLVLASAISAGADYLVTRDRQLLKLGSYQGAAILSPTEFLQQLQSRPLP